MRRQHSRGHTYVGQEEEEERLTLGPFNKLMSSIRDLSCTLTRSNGLRRADSSAFVIFGDMYSINVFANSRELYAQTPERSSG